MDVLLQYGVWGAVALVLIQIGVPLLKEHVLPVARDQREREIRAIESLAATMSRFGELLTAIDQRLHAVERDNEQTRADVAVLVERLPSGVVAPVRHRRKAAELQNV